MHNLHTEDNSCTTSQHKLEICISQQPSRNSVFSMNGWPTADIFVKFPTLFFLFFFFSFAYCVELFLKVYWQAYLALFRPLDFELLAVLVKIITRSNHRLKTLYRVFLLTWPASKQIYWNKSKRLHKKGTHLPQDWFETPTWPPFHCFGTPIWPPWRRMKTLYSFLNHHLEKKNNKVQCHRERLEQWIFNLNAACGFYVTQSWIVRHVHQ